MSGKAFADGIRKHELSNRQRLYLHGKRIDKEHVPEEVLHRGLSLAGQALFF